MSVLVLQLFIMFTSQLFIIFLTFSWSAVDGGSSSNSIVGPRRIRTSFAMEPDFTRAYYVGGGGGHSTASNAIENSSNQYSDQQGNYGELAPTAPLIEDHPSNYHHRPQQQQYQQPQQKSYQPQNSYQSPSSSSSAGCRKKNAENGYHYGGGGGGEKCDGKGSLEECIHCHMRPAEAKRFTKCQQYFREGLNNATGVAGGGAGGGGGGGSGDKVDKGDNGTLAVEEGSGGGGPGEDGALVTCCHLSRFMRCAAPLVMRACQHCALAAFVRQYRPHLELCHLVTTIQCPLADGRFMDEL